ncbi:MAG: hypothetical protein ACRDKS_02675 [Actinomycetota bacterium]
MRTADALQRGKGAFAENRWSDAYADLSESDSETPLDPADRAWKGLKNPVSLVLFRPWALR